MAQRTTTPAGVRMNKVYDEIRLGLRSMPADRAELMRGEILTLFVMIRSEISRWADGKSSTALYREGSVIEAAGGDYETVLRIAEMCADDMALLADQSSRQSKRRPRA